MSHSLTIYLAHNSINIISLAFFLFNKITLWTKVIQSGISRKCPAKSKWPGSFLTFSAKEGTFFPTLYQRGHSEQPSSVAWLIQRLIRHTVLWRGTNELQIQWFPLQEAAAAFVTTFTNYLFQFAGAPPFWNTTLVFWYTSRPTSMPVFSATLLFM